MSQTLNVITRNMAGGGAGDLLSLPSPSKTLQISVSTTGGSVALRVNKKPATGAGYVTPVAPTQTPVPAAGNNLPNGWIQLNAGDVWSAPLITDGAGYQDVEIWELTAGLLIVDGRV